VLMIAPAPTKADEAVSEEVQRTLKILLAELPLKQAAALAAQIHNEKKNALYQLALSWQVD
jgi:16S rRNA (cytidine1402-2'-O)-methyltransferase